MLVMLTRCQVLRWHTQQWGFQEGKDRIHAPRSKENEHD